MKNMLHIISDNLTNADFQDATNEDPNSDGFHENMHNAINNLGIIFFK